MAGPGRGPQAGPPDRGGAPGRGGFAALNLTDDQRTTIAGLQRASRDQAVPIEDELEYTRRTLHRELFADKRDNAKVTSLSAKVASLEKQLTDLRVKSQIAIADVLTPAQRETMRVMEPGRRGVGALRPLMRERLNAPRPN
jgi:Spy/CpxP family protein refolding chaperone